nr:retrotransposon protein, putative, Ty1-copia subclass [Tanacetum cinerariifolium]
MTLELANRAICTPAGIARDVFVSVGKFTFLVDFVIVDYERDPRVPLILGRPFLRTARALIDVHGEEMILRDGDERLTLNMRHDTSSYSNQPQKELINLINVFNNSSEDFLKDLFSTNQPSGNPTFLSHPELTSSEVKYDIFDPEGGNVLPDKLLDLDSTKDLYPPLHVNPLSGSTTYSSSPNQLLEELVDELALITFPPKHDDDLQFDIKSDLKEIELLLHQDIDFSFKDSINQSNLANLADNFVDSMPEMFTDEHALDYSSPSIFDEYDYDLFKVEVDAKPSTSNEDKVFNPGILIQENPFEIITHVVQDKKLATSNASLMIEDCDLVSMNLFSSKKFSATRLGCAETKVATWDDLAFNLITLGWNVKHEIFGENATDTIKRTKSEQKRTKLSTKQKAWKSQQSKPRWDYDPRKLLCCSGYTIKGSKEIVGLMLMTMEPEIQRNLENLHAHEMLLELKILFAQQAEHELLQTTRDFHSCKLEEGHLGKTINELHAMLKLHEQTLPKNNAPALHAIRAGKVQKGLRASRKLKPLALSLYVGNGQREAVKAIGAFYLCLPSGLEIVLNNCHYASSITRGVIYVSRLSTRTRRAPDRMCLYIDAEEHELGDLGEPANYKAALLDPEYEKWLNAMNVEMQSMKDNNVWVLVELPPNGKIVGIKWLFKKKTNMDGAVHTYKARLVAKGYTQTPEIDYEETFSRVADIRAIRILIAIAAYYDYEVWQMDAKIAFLNGYLNEEVYMEQPEGEAAYILGIKIYRDRSRRLIGLCQSAYIEKILKRNYMENSKRGSIPMQEKLKLSKSQGASTPAELKRMQNVPYALAVGSIMNTKDMFLVYGGDLKRELRVSCYTDAGYLTDADDLKSYTGYVFILNGGDVYWKSAKQSIFATSSVKAKYIATFDASKEAVWVRKFIYGLDIVPTIEELISMYCDNTGAIAIPNESRITKGARHFRAKVHYLYEVIEYGDSKVFECDLVLHVLRQIGSVGLLIVKCEVQEWFWGFYSGVIIFSHLFHYHLLLTSRMALGEDSEFTRALRGRLPVRMELDRRGKRAFIAGVADDNRYGWAIAKSLVAAGAEILVGTWVPVHWEAVRLKQLAS